ncbi:hypothetical protein RD792_007322 [Penstemon davidsonii]|uniref:F-box domain-containing protein n=1 Tax=Penstemon davidsonii TaxID=160366 RepID=A0ABR0D635_9LAMI|nr:hypothetical protein RD792_007322 [Penstemon davidsonii]
MNALIRKVWFSFTHRSGSGSDRNPNTEYDRFLQMMYIQSSSTGEFDRIPIDIFMIILRKLGPRDSARLRAVCKSWKFLVSDNRLWIYFLQNQQEPFDSVFFAEAHLRSGYPLQYEFSKFYKPHSFYCLKLVFPAPMSDLSFMHIYSQRIQVPGAIIIDGGSGYSKYGWSKYSSPSGRSATFLEFGNIESPMPSRLRHFFSTICNRMQVKTSTQPIVVSIPLCHYDGKYLPARQEDSISCLMLDLRILSYINPQIGYHEISDTESAKFSRRQLKDAIYTTLFDMNVPFVCAINQATLALFAARRTSGIVVNVGFHQTSVVPILHGKVMHKVGVEVVGMGALKLTGFLRDRMQQNNINVDSLYTVRTLKENLCYVALDYEAELSKDTEASFRVTSNSWFTLSKERFQTGEILFKPRIAGVQAMGLHQAVALCMDHCHDAELTSDDNWYKTVVLAGGSACMAGLAERLEKELHELQTTSMANGIRVLPPPYGADSVWHGAKLLSNVTSSDLY